MTVHVQLSYPYTTFHWAVPDFSQEPIIAQGDRASTHLFKKLETKSKCSIFIK